MPNSPGYVHTAEVVPLKIKKDGRAGRRIKKVYTKTCPNCNKIFVGIAKQRFCSEPCKGEYKYTSGSVTTDSQYSRISGNWRKYFQRLCCRSNKRADISAEECLELLEKQKGKCALSGVELTCKLEKGVKFKTNASLDRIEAGGPYIKENVQLVCSALNSWRGDTDLSEFVWWCRKVTQFQEKEGTHHA